MSLIVICVANLRLVVCTSPKKLIITRWINCGVSLFLMPGENHKHGRINCLRIVIFNYFHSSINKSCLSKPPRSPMKLGVNN